MLKRVLLPLTAVAAAMTLAACGSSGNNATTATDTVSPAPGVSSSPASSSASSASTPTGTATSPGPTASSQSTAPAAMPTGDAAPKNVTCSYSSDGQGSAGKAVTLPPSHPTAGGVVKAVIKTSSGAVPIQLDAAKSPCTVNSFLSLATQGFFTNTPCHRLTTSGIYVLQCGDPSGTGMGGPGYRFADELSGHDTYPAGTLAMANSGPDTNGSQFFLCYGDSSALDSQPNYTVFGKIEPAGLKVLEAVATKGTVGGTGDGAPVAKTKILGISFS